MIGKIIAFAGIHSSGKTTGVLEIVSELKKMGINAWFVVDVARTARLPINEKGTWLTQEVIAHRMGVQLLEAAAKYDVVISDRTLLDCLAYSLAIDIKESSPEYIRLKHMCYNFVAAHNSLIFQIVDPINLQNDGIRSTNNDYHEKTGTCFNYVYNQAKILLPQLTIHKILDFKNILVRNSVLTDIVEEIKK